MNAVAYVRVSSEAQNHSTQRHAVERASEARGDTVTEWYAERLSGKSLDRPELKRLRADVRAGNVRRLYVYRLDRLTRSGITDTLTVMEEFRAYGCKVISVADGFDLDGPAAEIILAVIGWASKMERIAINERMSAARKRMEASGRSWGRPGRLTPAQVAEVAQRRAAGESVRGIAIAMHVPRATIGRAVSKVALKARGADPSGPTPRTPSPAD